VDRVGVLDVMCGRRQGAAMLATLATTIGGGCAHAATTSSSSLFCGYFDEYSNGLVPQYAFNTPWNEGYVDGADGAKTFVRGVGDYKKAKKEANAPVFVIANGPGISHEYLSGVETLSGEVGGAREVFEYDQRGCGKSDAVGGERNIDVYLNEARDVVKALRLADEGGAHVLAHGYWGARIALTLALETPGLVRSLTLVSPAPSYARQVADWRLALDEVSQSARDAILTYEQDLDARARPAYDDAMREFSSKFVTRRGASGGCFDRALAPASCDAQRLAITGGKYFTLDGSLAQDTLPLAGLGAKLGANGVKAVRVVRGEFDAVRETSAREIVDAVNADANQGAPFCAYDDVPNAASCVFLDRGDYFFETLNVCVETAESS
jgi:proline iminopeptidase